MGLMLEPKYIWLVSTDSHGTVGYWDTREGAIEEVYGFSKRTTKTAKPN